MDGADGRRIVNVKVLTVAQSLAWFDGDGGTYPSRHTIQDESYAAPGAI